MTYGLIGFAAIASVVGVIFFLSRRPPKPKRSPFVPDLAITKTARKSPDELVRDYRAKQRAPSAVLRPAPPDLETEKWVGWNFCGRLDVAGVHFHKGAAERAYLSASFGDHVELIPDPQNENDKNAITVWIAGEWVGFVDRHTARTASKILPQGMPICARYVDGWRGDSGSLRLTIQPLMPDAKSRKLNGWDVTKSKVRTKLKKLADDDDLDEFDSEQE